MKGPTYILKKTHLEHEEKREYKQHMLKLQNIQGQRLKGDLKRSISVDKKFVQDKQKKTIQNRLFKEEEVKREQKLENKALIAKLEEIQKGKFSIVKSIKDQNFKESIQYLGANQGMKSGMNFNPSTSRTRLRTMTANTESSRNFPSQNNFNNRNYDQYEDQSNAPHQERDSKNANFFNNNSNHPNKTARSYSNNTGDQSLRGNSSNPNGFGQQYPNNGYGQNQYGQGMQNNPNNGLGQNSQHPNAAPGGVGSNQNGYPYGGNGNQLYNNSNQGGSHQSFSTGNNPNSTNGKSRNKENDPDALLRDAQLRVLKTEGNYNDDEQDSYKIGDNQNSSRPNFYNNQNNNMSTGQFNQHGGLIGDDRYNNPKTMDITDRNKSMSRDGKRKRINSSINLAQLNKHVSASIDRQKEQERIAFENNKIVARMMKLPPVVPTKNNLKKEVNKQKKLLKQLSKFHEFKERKAPQFAKNKNIYDPKTVLGLIDGVPLDENNQELMDQRIHLVINMKEIAFVNFLPVSTETEKYFMEIQASIHEIRRTNPEIYTDFSKSVVNEFFYLRELKQSRMIYIGLYKWTPLDNGEHFLGDFELDLTPYYLQSGVHQIHYDLRNFKQMHKQPNYMVKDMRKKGWIDIEISVRSSVKQYLMDLDIIKKDYGSQEASIHYEDPHHGQYINPAEKKKNSDESLVHMMNQHQNPQTEKQQKLQQLKYQLNPKQKGMSAYNSQNTSMSQPKKINGIQQQRNSQSNHTTDNHITNGSSKQVKNRNNQELTHSNNHNNSAGNEKYAQEEQYDQDNFEKEDSSGANDNNQYDQQFLEQEDLGNNHTNQQHQHIEEDIEL